MTELQIKGTVGAKSSTLTVWEGENKAFEIVLDVPGAGAAIFREGRRAAHLSRGPWASWNLFQDDVRRARIRPDLLGWSFDAPFVYSPLSALTLAGLRALSGRAHTLAVCELEPGGKRYFLQQRRGDWDLKINDRDGVEAARFQRSPDGYSLELRYGADRFLFLGMCLFVLKTIQQREADAETVRVLTSNPVLVLPPGRRVRRRRRWIDDPVPPARGRRHPFPHPMPIPFLPRQRQKWIDDPVERQWRRGFPEAAAEPQRDKPEPGSRQRVRDEQVARESSKRGPSAGGPEAGGSAGDSPRAEGV